jgi:hypothetical protein
MNHNLNKEIEETKKKTHFIISFTFGLVQALPGKGEPI